MYNIVVLTGRFDNAHKQGLKYKPQYNNYEEELEKEDEDPEWDMSFTEKSTDGEWFDGAVFGSTSNVSRDAIREFEEWKAHKRTIELRKQGIDVNEVTIDSTADTAVDLTPDENQSGVDSMLGLWKQSTTKVSGPPSGSASRFSQFFSTDSPKDGNAQLAGSSPVPSHSTSTNLPGEVSGSATNADKEGFQRIMNILGEEPKPEPTNGDEQFFMSLLNKGSEKQDVSKSTGSPSASAAHSSVTSPQAQAQAHAQVPVPPAPPVPSFNGEEPFQPPIPPPNFDQFPPGLHPQFGIPPPPPPPGFFVDQNGNPADFSMIPPGGIPPPPPPGMLPYFPPIPPGGLNPTEEVPPEVAYYLKQYPPPGFQEPFRK